MFSFRLIQNLLPASNEKSLSHKNCAPINWVWYGPYPLENKIAQRKVGDQSSNSKKRILAVAPAVVIHLLSLPNPFPI
jgi:hypothetical protein